MKVTVQGNTPTDLTVTFKITDEEEKAAFHDRVAISICAESNLFIAHCTAPKNYGKTLEPIEYDIPIKPAYTDGDYLNHNIPKTLSPWISASTPPPDDRPVLIYWKVRRHTKSDEKIYLGYYQHHEHNEGYWRPIGSNGNYNDEITHWMPLPDPPTEGVAP